MRPDKSQHRLFVEGPSDGAVINKLVQRRLAIDLATPRIIEAGPEGDGGFDRALERFRAAIQAHKPERLGLVVDRDGAGGKPDRWGTVREVLRASGLEVAPQPKDEGVRAAAAWGRVGVWLMPDNVTPGDLESFVETLLPEQPKVWAFAGEAVVSAKALGAKYRPVDQAKARFHTWLAWQDPPGIPYGTAIEAEILGARSPVAEAFIDWLEWLFGD